MIDRVVFTSDADDDVTASYERHPEMYPIAIDEFRRAPIRRFPFEVFYELTVDYLFRVSLFTRSVKVAQASRLLSAHAPNPSPF